MSPKRVLLKCSYDNCTASFTRPDRLKNHLRVHSGERPYTCHHPGCDRSYASSQHLKRHEVTHITSFKCTVKGCSEVLKTNSSLKRHIDNIHKKKHPKQYKCTECDKQFNKHNWLQRHTFKHSGVYPHLCTFDGCDKGFLLPSKLRRHLQTHKGHKCKIPGCEKTFLKWSLYVAHVKEFHPKVHKCDTCGREFSSSSNLKQHAAIHEDKRQVFACEMPNCSRYYFAEKNLVWHEKHYHDARAYSCDRKFCHKAFKTKDLLDQHSARHLRRKPRKKKKPRPTFSAILAGCADPRKFIRNMPPKKIDLKSCDDSTSDNESLKDVLLEGSKIEVPNEVFTDKKESEEFITAYESVNKFLPLDESFINSSIESNHFEDRSCKQIISEPVKETNLDYRTINQNILKESNIKNSHSEINSERILKNQPNILTSSDPLSDKIQRTTKDVELNLNVHNQETLNKTFYVYKFITLDNGNPTISIEPVSLDQITSQKSYIPPNHSTNGKNPVQSIQNSSSNDDPPVLFDSQNNKIHLYKLPSDCEVVQAIKRHAVSSSLTMDNDRCLMLSNHVSEQSSSQHCNASNTKPVKKRRRLNKDFQQPKLITDNLLESGESSSSSEEDDLTCSKDGNGTSEESDYVPFDEDGRINNIKDGCKRPEKHVDESASEYETITVSVFGSKWYKSCSEGEEISSCLSEAEDLLNCQDIGSRRGR